MNLAIVSSPTGGHLIPAALVAREAENRGHQVELWSHSRIQRDWLPHFKGPVRTLIAHPWAGQKLAGRVLSLAGVLEGWLNVRTSIQEADAVLGFGGFASVPALLAGWEQGVPLFLHEQNRVPGRTTELFGPFATRTFFGFPPEGTFRGTGEVIGTPVRELVSDPGDWFANKPLLVVVGGSQGARELSARLLAVADVLMDRGWFIYLLHGRHGDPLSELAERRPEQFRSDEFNPELPSVIARARVVWSRAGAGSLSELIRFQRPAVLFPYPHAADDHQRKNAEFIARSSPARVVRNNTSDEQLLAWTVDLSDSTRKYGWTPPTANPEQRILERIEQCVPF